MLPLRKAGLLASLLVFWALPVSAQEAETLFGSSTQHGGFGGPVIKFSMIEKDFAVFVGGRGGWIINFQPDQTLVLGGGGYGLVTDYELPEFSTSANPVYLDFGYGGFELEYVNRTKKLIHVAANVLIGGGGVGIRNSSFNSIDGTNDTVFVLEPGLHLMINMAHFFRIGAGASYRYVNGVSTGTLSDSDLSRPAWVLTFKFGKF